MIDYSRYYRAYVEMQETLKGDFANGYLTSALSDSNSGSDVMSGDAYNRVIDMEWVEQIEEALPYIDKAIREDRKFIETYEEVERVDKVKQVTKDAVRHLTQHTSLIQAVNNGEVSPSKLLNTRREDSYATYENRFLYTLIQRIISFVEARFRALKEAPNDSYTKMEMSREVKLNHQQFAFSLTYSAESHERSKVDKEEDVASLSDYERIARIRLMLSDFVGTKLIQTLNGCIQVRSPINKTNCIKKDPNFAKCYDLWTFIESYRKTGYVVESNKYSGEMEHDVQSELYNVMAFQHFVMTISTNKALKEKLHDDYVAENERRARDKNKPEDEMQKYMEEQIYEARREEMALRLKEVRERDMLIAQLTTELEIEKEKVRQKDLKIAELQTLLTVREKELEQTKQELFAAKQRIVELETELEQAKARIAELEDIVEKQAAQIAAQLATIAALEQKIDTLEAEIEKLNAEIAQLKDKVAELEATVAQQKAQIEAQTKKIASLEEKVANLEDEIRTLNAEIAELKAENAELKATVNRQSEEIKTHLSEISDLKANEERLNQNITVLASENSDLKNTIDAQETTIGEQKSEIEEKTIALSASNEKVSSLTGELQSLKVDYSDLSEKYAGHQEELKKLNNTISQSKEAENELNHQIRVHLNMLSAKEAIISNLNEVNADFKSKIADYDAKIEQSNSLSKSAQEKLSQSEAARTELESSLKSQNDDIASRDKKIAELSALVEQSTVSTNTQISELNTQHSSELSKLSAQHSDEIEKLKAKYEQKLLALEQEKLAACNFTDEQKYSLRLNAQTKAIKEDYNKKLKKAKKKARTFVLKARVLVDDSPEIVLNLPDVSDYK